MRYKGSYFFLDHKINFLGNTSFNIKFLKAKVKKEEKKTLSNLCLSLI